MKRTYRIALICGAAPLLAGVLIFLLWLAFRWEWLATAGLLTIVSGIFAVVFGAATLARHCWLAFRDPACRTRRTLILVGACAALLLLNFPVAYGIVNVVARIGIVTHYTVIVHNYSPFSINDAHITGPGCNIALGSISSGETVQHKCTISGEGSLEFRAFGATTTYVETINHYVSTGMDGHSAVSIDSNGKISIAN